MKLWNRAYKLYGGVSKVQNDPGYVGLFGLGICRSITSGAQRARSERGQGMGWTEIKLKGMGESEERACRSGSSVPDSLREG